jgi:putative transposase
VARERDDEGPLSAAIIELGSQYGRYGYRRITALIQQDGWHVNTTQPDRTLHSATDHQLKKR